jgi:NAD(P)-dependent dehydrogenase (short-subunit alcohol dehydrogenase family)
MSERGDGAASQPAGRLVVVTGSGGIGLACAEAFRDHPLLLADISEAQLQSAAAALRDAGSTVDTQLCDVSDPGATQRLAEAAAAQGEIAALVHTAGISGTLCDSASIFRVNLMGSIHILDAFEPYVTEGTVGICIASIGGHQEFTHSLDPLLAAPSPLERLDDAGALSVGSSPAYAIAKRAVIVQCRRRAAAWGIRGGRLLSVSPGLIVDTPMGAASMERGPGRPYAKWSAAGRTGRATEVAKVIRFLASSDASFMTGCDVLVDGGLLAGIDHHVDLETRERWHACAYNYLGRQEEDADARSTTGRLH